MLMMNDDERKPSHVHVNMLCNRNKTIINPPVLHHIDALSSTAEEVYYIENGQRCNNNNNRGKITN